MVGVLPEKYIMQLLVNYKKSKEGKERIAKFRRDFYNGKHGSGTFGLLDRDDVEVVVDEIREKFAKAVVSVIQSFRVEGISTEIGDINDDGKVRASIDVNEDDLRRESLHYVTKDLSIKHGEGVDDILALFTHGYTINGRRPYGFWVRDNVTADSGDPLTRIGALMHRDPNPFLSEFVDQMNAEYGDVCDVKLNDKYTGGGL